MAPPKTTKNDASVDTFLSKVAPSARRDDAEALVALFERAIGCPACMWGTSIVGFGDSSYANTSGKDIPWFVSGFAPRAQNFALYLSTGELDTSGPLFSKLGKHSTGKGCLYIGKLADVDAKVLEAIVRAAAAAKAKTSGKTVSGKTTSSKAAPAKKKITAKAASAKAPAPRPKGNAAPKRSRSV